MGSMTLPWIPLELHVPASSALAASSPSVLCCPPRRLLLSAALFCVFCVVGFCLPCFVCFCYRVTQKWDVVRSSVTCTKCTSRPQTGRVGVLTFLSVVDLFCCLSCFFVGLIVGFCLSCIGFRADSPHSCTFTKATSDLTGD